MSYEGPNAIEAARVAKGIPVSIVAHELGITDQGYHDFQNNLNNTNAFQVLKVCKLLGVNFNEI